MLPQKRPTPFRVAAQTVLGCGRLNELLGIRAAVRIVTTSARHLSFAVRHMRRTLQLRTPHLVACQAQLRLRLFRTVDVGQRRVKTRIG